MNIDNTVLKDIIENTPLTEEEVNLQFEKILTIFKQSRKPYSLISSINELHTYLLVNFPTYLKSLYNTLQPSYQRPAEVASSSDFDALLLTGIVANNQTTMLNSNVSTIAYDTPVSSTTDISNDKTASISDSSTTKDNSVGVPDSNPISFADLTPSYNYDSTVNTTSDPFTSISSSSSSYDSSSSYSSSSSYDSGSSSSSSFDSSSSSSSYDSSSFWLIIMNIDSDFIEVAEKLFKLGVDNPIISRDKEGQIKVEYLSDNTTPLLDEFDQLIPNQNLIDITYLIK